MTNAEFLQYSNTLREKALPNDAKGPIGDLIDAFRARVDELELRLNEEWRPIETAPKESGETFLVAFESGKVIQVIVMPDGSLMSFLNDYGTKITRWKPLPEPPEEKP
jgi:hypothetical protein